ncbi:peptidoglycan-binding domain-containing protein [Enemella evansiae]|uniref:peptidoglycan-binding domain-containing protein n=1 Tax=Enemella evansiae TaxID=2016499 RepID=UPI000B973DC3|nr:peptidoglycan-binding protein [Enemella evansiae]PFG68559.1 putative peptidoglycan binding protein [Propionibacteriaceae bacterium ES.041]OYN95416.1 hypothetical protein CGZ95_17005 [Enemella evansiae]OYO01730.1 hypothetical protein CGZ96_03780 [Enemella evansiae]OYO03524.1 hypothetical protein CGZ97_08785 [Enemella evansiae]OYO09950.1 hypothetical protein CGZ98_12625 [Enemella evansiae]
MNTRRIAALTAAAVTGLTTVTGVVGFGISQSTAAGSSASCSIDSTPVVKYGARGEAVKDLQCVLNSNGAKLAVDGRFGPKTKAAVLSYQKAKGLEVDGIVGPKTWASLKANNGGGGKPTTPPPSNGNVSADRQQVLKRAATWLTAYNGGPVPYSQTKFFQGYRQDCSGYVSMALGLGKPGLNTVGLADSSVTKRISLNELKPGDLLIDSDGTNNTRHVVIFEKWTDSSRTAYKAYEQTGDGDKTRYRVLKYGLDAGSQYKPRRPLKYGD